MMSYQLLPPGIWFKVSGLRIDLPRFRPLFGLFGCQKGRSIFRTDL